MAFPIKSFTADGIAGGRTYTVNFKDPDQPVTIIVGPNGTGKSTLLNLYYLLITCQWARLSQIEFNLLELELLNGQKISLNATDMLISSNEKRYPPSIARAIESLGRSGFLRDLLTTKRLSPNKIQQISEETNIPSEVLRNINRFSLHDPNFFDFSLLDVESKIRNIDLGLVLYLPTFRRIEKDIRSILPEMEDSRNLRTRRSAQMQGENFIELIKFGMEDVDQIISEYLSMINGKTRQSSSKASQEFIRDVVGGQIEQFSVASLDFNRSDISQFIDRLDSELLQEADREKLRTFIEKSANRKQGKPPKHEQYLAYFVYKMYRVFEETRRLEEPLFNFKRIVDNYFSPEKLLVYDLTDIFVKDAQTERQIKLDDLSSGEKQIFAVFAYLLFSQEKDLIVLIDEPELSLSVPWQKNFLQDMVGTGRCSQLFSVTHSPFIVSEVLESSMVDVRKLAGHAG